MKFLEFCRNKSFWLMDLLRGGHIRKAYEIIEKCDKGIWSDKEIETYQKNAIDKLLDHAKKTVPAYYNQKLSELSQWPVVSKVVLKENIDKHISKIFNREDLIVMSTSGSTGTPFRCYQDVIKKRHVNAEVLYYNGLVDFKIGRRIIYFRSIVSEVSKSRLTQFLQNIRLIDCQSLSDEKIRKKLREIRYYSKNGGGMILSYASTLDGFRKYFQKYGYKDAQECNVYGIVSGSEMLQDITRETLEKAFNCKVVSRYANEENGFLGQDDIVNNVFIPNRADYYYEILKLSSDDPAAIGEVGRIVVTDLYNYAMPFVRYDTGDVGAWVEIEHCGKKVKAIGNFGGRVVDMIFDTEGHPMSPHIITNNMWEYQEIKQYQFIQRECKQYVMKINVENAEFTQENSLRKALLHIVGQDADIRFEYCDDIPILASGKRRYIVNEMLMKK